MEPAGTFLDSRGTSWDHQATELGIVLEVQSQRSRGCAQSIEHASSIEHLELEVISHTPKLAHEATCRVECVSVAKHSRKRKAAQQASRPGG